MKKILHISTSDSGGAGSLAFRFCQLFRENGHDSKLLVLDKFLRDKDVIGFRNKSRFLYRLVYKLWRIVKRNNEKSAQLKTVSKYHFLNPNETLNVVETKKLISKLSYKPDVIFIYWISNFLNAKNIRELNELTGAPIFWVLTDMAPLTGGCHYAWDCNGFSENCNICPAIEKVGTEGSTVASKNLKFKLNNLANVELSFILPTLRLKEQFLSSNFSQKKWILNYLPIDAKQFKPIGKTIARKSIQLLTDKKVIFFGASDMRDERKGMKLLVASLHKLKALISNNNIDVYLLVAGRYCEEILANLPFEYKYLGNITSLEVLNNVYSASDVFVCPSIQDSGPMMINESLMCGTPIVAFKDVGIANDLVIDGITGYLVTKKNTEEMASRTMEILLLSDGEYKKLSEKSRELAHTLFSKEKVYQKFLNAINSIR